MIGKQGDFIENFSSLNLKREEKEFLNQKLKEADKDFLTFLKEIFSSFQQKITKDETFLNFVLQEVEVSSRLLFETSHHRLSFVVNIFIHCRLARLGKSYL